MKPVPNRNGAAVAGEVVAVVAGIESLGGKTIFSKIKNCG